MGKRFLFTAWPFPGHVFPLIALAHALRRLGHESAFYTGAQSSSFVRQEGFECFPFRHVDEEGIDRLMRGRSPEPWRASSIPSTARLLRRWLLDTVADQVKDLDALIRSWRPDVIGADLALWAPILVLSETHAVPVAVCSSILFYPLPGPGVPPFGPGLPRRARGAAALATVAVRAANRVAARVARSRANVVRRRHGLGPIPVSPTEYTARMPLYLIPSVRELDYDRRDPPPHVHYIGPCLFNRPRTQAPTPWLADLRRDVPWVHVTEGTTHIHKPLVLQAALRGLAGLPMQVIATTGGTRSVEELGVAPISDNIRVAQWVAHADLLPHTDAVVTTGGAGTVLAALAAGVPLVLVPTEWDKPETAQRVVEAGVGLRLSPRECTPARLREAVSAVLEVPSYRANARRLAEVIARHGGAERGAELLVELSERPR
ncbi:MAG TPA: nucleotide disphospho-sugar-binding domain-containing protein [Vicinamibacteria bacterium]|nr:nucleotide disphospho-sugar-binding domain-containing protein [Vicinamibacteria bacterium]